MFCEHCKKRPATVFYTEIINKKFSQVKLCAECAQQKGLGVFPFKAGFSVPEFLDGLMEPSPGSAEDAPESPDRLAIRCPGCGITYGEFKKEGFFGCAACYETFRGLVLPLFRHLHGTSRHVGRLAPAAKAAVALAPKPAVASPVAPPRLSEMARLKASLTEAIQREEFEEAARLRDEIKRLTDSHG